MTWDTSRVPSRNATPLTHPDTDEIDLTAVLSALGDPVRLGLVAALAAHDGDVACGTFALPVGKSTASHHFRVLRDAGVLRQYDAGTRRFNQLRRTELDERFPGLLSMVLAEGRRVEVGILETAS